MQLRQGMRRTNIEDVGTGALGCLPVPLRHMVMPLGQLSTAGG
jgi:hypothetical protein